jgi:hypothetical protein
MAVSSGFAVNRSFEIEIPDNASSSQVEVIQNNVNQIMVGIAEIKKRNPFLQVP